uniref:Thioredoxin domain-containing protein n=1 Tax=Noctiluca scintillans TaxID=2966 RepID=A0A7S1ACL0_NOCSC|mmetsp:Transcript_40384/g.107098  ORF Transcript_40384/g.107098 Transcript_40384/m.107098 type:complete len:154 (+) Transcript_40384:56-517(+)
MALRLARRALAPAIKDFGTYNVMKTQTPVMVGLYTGHFSLGSKILAEQFESMEKSYPKYSFYTCDVDDCPQAAYDAEVVDVPSVVILPLGLKPDGSNYDKTDMVVVSAELAKYTDVIPQAKAALDSITVLDSDSEKKPWVFDPATGTTLPPHN